MNLPLPPARNWFGRQHVPIAAYIGAFFDYGGIRAARYQSHYSLMAKELGLPFPSFIHEGNLSGVPDANLRITLEKVLSALRAQYNDPFYTGDFMFVIQPLKNERWRFPRLSPDVCEIVLNREEK